MQEDTEISALIRLLDDPDDAIYEQVKTKIVSLGPSVIPSLEDAWESQILGVLFQNRVEELIHEIQFDLTCEQLSEWTKDGATSLLEGALIVCRYQYPDLDEEQMLKVLEQIQQDVWLELNSNLTAFEQVKVINHILFEIHGFTGNTSNYHAPQNSFLNIVLESKKGNPLSLSLIYSIIAQNLDLPIYGVNLPRHFVLAYLDRFSLFKTNNIYSAEVLFYINPFSRGTVFSKKEIDYFLKQLKLDTEDKYYQPCTNAAIIQRVLNNLQHSYKKLGDEEKFNEIDALNKIVSKGIEG